LSFFPVRDKYEYLYSFIPLIRGRKKSMDISAICSADLHGGRKKRVSAIHPARQPVSQFNQNFITFSVVILQPVS
jgi:hypothetical protein